MSKRKDVPAKNCGNLKNGGAEKSKFKSMLAEYDYSILDKVDKLEFNNIIKETVARKIALQLDLESNAEMAKLIKEHGVYVFKDEMDLIELRAKLADVSKDVQFYKIELKKLKGLYDTVALEEQDGVLEKMEFFEKQIARYDSSYNKTKELMNKIRFQINRRKQWQEEQKLKFKDEKIIDVSDFDFSEVE